MNKDTPLLFTFPGSAHLAASLRNACRAEEGQYELHTFPDGETRIRLEVPVKDRTAYVLCTLHRPNELFLPLYLLAMTLKDHGARKVVLVAPYLSYMRQDIAFRTGEGVSALHFAKLLQSCFDELVTIDPHLHRFHSLSELYSIPCSVLSSAGPIAAYIREHWPHALIIGPDSESAQWVETIAARAGVAFTVLEKTREGDKKVRVSVPGLAGYRDRMPVLVDDILSTGRTMAETARHLREAGMPAPVCIAIHALFSADAESVLAGAGCTLVSCNTIAHPSNRIDIGPLFETIG